MNTLEAHCAALDLFYKYLEGGGGSEVGKKTRKEEIEAIFLRAKRQIREGLANELTKVELKLTGDCFRALDRVSRAMQRLELELPSGGGKEEE